jgi:hypothetical protein
VTGWGATTGRGATLASRVEREVGAMAVTDPETVRYPPEPWHLGGTMLLSLWGVPTAELPTTLAATLPTGARPVRLGGRAVVGTAFVTYEPGGVLSYDELLAATLTWHRGRPRVTISDIWVDAPASVAGGRELWGIPKQLAAFERRERGPDVGVRAHAHGAELARVTFARRRRLPGAWPLPMRTAQRLDGVDHVSRVRALGSIVLGRARWRFPASGPLGFLAGRTPVTSARLEELAIAFGQAREASHPIRS